jgi:AcrR family transcriptional regulator
MQIAARRFAAEGVDAVRLDEIADEADIARATLYSHFATKEALVAAIVRPALQLALREAGKIPVRVSRQAVRSLLRVYLTLWKEHPDAMRVAHRTQGVPLGDCAGLHIEFMQHVLRIFGSASVAGLLRSEIPTLSAMLLARLAIPMLETYAGHVRADELFLDSMEALLLHQREDRQRVISKPATSRRPHPGKL